MRTTLADIRDTQIPQVLQLCANDATGRLQRYLNEAVVRLLPRGQWRGTVVRYRLCPSANCITWPRHVESILAFSICARPGVIRSHWYEFLGYGPGNIPLSSDCSGDKLKDRGLAVAFDDICGENKKIRVYCDLPADAGKTILLQGYDSNRNWVLTGNGDVNGELVTLAMPWVDTSTVWMPSGLAGVQKQLTKGPVRLYELDTTTALQRPLAIYEPDELVPEYRRSVVPGMTDGSATDAPDSCAQPAVTVLAKLKFIPVRAETDYLLIGNTAALKDMCQAIKKREDNHIAEALTYEASAIAVLEQELSNFHGDGTQDPAPAMNANMFAPMGVESMVL
jgi:hypothetical protein